MPMQAAMSMLAKFTATGFAQTLKSPRNLPCSWNLKLGHLFWNCPGICTFALENMNWSLKVILKKQPTNNRLNLWEQRVRNAGYVRAR